MPGKRKKKVNPNRIPRTEADVKKAISFSVDCAWAIIMTVLRDKEGISNEQLRHMWDGVNELSDGVAKGYVSVQDLMKTLEEEAGITFG